MAYQKSLRLLLLSTVILVDCSGAVGANSNQVVRGWRVDEFLSSTATSAASAGAEETDKDNSDNSASEVEAGDSKSSLSTMMVVDPDGILNEPSREELNSKVYNFVDDVTVSIPDEEQSFAVQLAIAIVERMDLSSYQEGKDEEIAAEEFSRKLHDVWGVGHETAQGGTGVVVFLSVYDRVIYISKGGALDKVLSDSRIESIIRNVRPALKQANYFKGLMQAVDGIRQYCTQGEPDWTERLLNFLEGPYLYIFIWLGILVNGIFGAYRQREQARVYAQAQSQLSELDRARAQALQGQYQVSSCPICLENFVSSEIGSDSHPIKLLRCGHCFDETCWSEWINSGQGTITKCPICKKDIGDASSSSEAIPPPTETSQQQNNDDNNNSLVENIHHHDVPQQRHQHHPEAERAVQRFQQERNFRLMRLATRYPRYISNNQLRRWTSPTYNGDLARDPTFLNNNPRVVANRGNGGLGGRNSGGGARPSFSFGGGSSSGGRGGRF